MNNRIMAFLACVSLTGVVFAAVVSNENMSFDVTAKTEVVGDQLVIFSKYLASLHGVIKTEEVLVELNRRFSLLTDDQQVTAVLLVENQFKNILVFDQESHSFVFVAAKGVSIKPAQEVVEPAVAAAVRSNALNIK